MNLKFVSFISYVRSIIDSVNDFYFLHLYKNMANELCNKLIGAFRAWRKSVREPAKAFLLSFFFSLTLLPFLII